MGPCFYHCASSLIVLESPFVMLQMTFNFRGIHPLHDRNLGLSWSEMVQEVRKPSLQIMPAQCQILVGKLGQLQPSTLSASISNHPWSFDYSKALRVGSIIPHFPGQTSARTPHDLGPCEGWILAGSTCRCGSHHALSPAIHQSTPDDWDKFDPTVMKEQSWTVPLPVHQMYLYLHIQYATKKWKFGRDKFHSQVNGRVFTTNLYKSIVWMSKNHTCALYFEGSPVPATEPQVTWQRLEPRSHVTR